MDGRRITASPRPCNGRRVVAKKRRRVVAKKLHRREICSKTDRGFRISDVQERFRNICLQFTVGSIWCIGVVSEVCVDGGD
ncbi:hypothetical protein Hanom_Chr09g00769161 [Helianthus anomalus]